MMLSWWQLAWNRWPNAKWIANHGRFAVVSTCMGRETITLHQTRERAEKVLTDIDPRGTCSFRYGCMRALWQDRMKPRHRRPGGKSGKRLMDEAEHIRRRLAVASPPDLKATTEFLTAFFGNAPWNLTAIHKAREGRSIMKSGATFVGPDRIQRVCHWISEHHAQADDMYFAVNPLKIELGGKKFQAAKADVAAATHLWVDADPPSPKPGMVVQLEAEVLLKRART